MTSQDFWIGPYNIRVSKSIKSVVAEDGYNSLYSDGTETEKYETLNIEMTQELYLKMYAEKRDDGYYWYKENTWSWGNTLEPSSEMIEKYKNAPTYEKSDLKKLPVTKF